jgi:hypothetical protein
MTPEQYAQQQAFERRLAMMSSEAWKEFVEEVIDFKEVVDKIYGVKTVEDLFLRQGKVELCLWIESLKETTEQAYQQLKDDDATTP